MKIEHIAIWTTQLEELKAFYEKYFSAQAGEKYINKKRYFESYFLSFPSGGTRLEIMRIPTIEDFRLDKKTHYAGYIHLAISVGSKDEVDNLTLKLKVDGYIVFDEPRTTGDGYYESVILDPDNNHIEITI